MAKPCDSSTINCACEGIYSLSGLLAGIEAGTNAVKNFDDIDEIKSCIEKIELMAKQAHQELIKIKGGVCGATNLECDSDGNE